MATVAPVPSPLTAITAEDLPLDILPTRNNSTHHRESTVHRESVDSACIEQPTRPDSASITIADPVANPYIHDFKDKDGNPVDDQVAVPVIVLPEYIKPDEEFDHDDHSWCCALAPTLLHPSAVDEAGIKPLWHDNPSLSPNRLGLVATAWTSEGDRKYMEDRHRIVYGGTVDVANILDFRVFAGVYDGHGGDEAAHVTAHVMFEKFAAVYKADPNADMKTILLRTYAEMETHIIRESLNVGWVAGTTAVSVFIIGDKIYCVNTGDSRAVLCRGTTAIGLSIDHRPSAESEKLRVLAANGIVKQAVRRRRRCGCFGPPFVEEGSVRVWPGGFSVSRTLGDVQYKVPELGFIAPEHVGVLIPDADITVTDISPMDRFIILASDGFWDVMNNEEAVELGRKYIDKYDPQYVAEKLVAKAYSMGSDDNITVVAIFFTHHPKEGSRWHMVSSNSAIRQQQDAPPAQVSVIGPEISPSSSTNCESTSTSVAGPSAVHVEKAGVSAATNSVPPEPPSMADPASIVDH